MTLASHKSLPLVVTWDQRHRPLPIRVVRHPQPITGNPLGLEAPPWYQTGPTDQPFDFCAAIRRLCADIAQRCPELRHVDVSRLLFDMTQARSTRRHGLQARVTPLRFPEGRLERHRRGVRYQVQRYIVDNREMLYLMTFCLPRFLDQSFDEKFITLFHELYHIGPAFDGDFRRHPGRCSVHSRSKHEYDRHMALLARAYLATRPEPALFDFMRLTFVQLQHRHGSVRAVTVPRPKVIPVAARINPSPQNINQESHESHE